MDYIISDLHLGDKGVIRFERTEFATIEEHDAALVRYWNSTIVNKDDTVYFLGDLCDNASKKDMLTYLQTIVPRLRGHKIMIRGNHDHFKDDEYIALGFERVITGPYFYRPNIILSHEPCREAYENPYVWNIHGHLHNAELELPNYKCVSARHIKYKPMSLTKYAMMINSRTKKRTEYFMEEWYAPHYNFMKYELQYDENGRVDSKRTIELAIPRKTFF